MIAKCIKGGCGYEFENENPNTFFETIDEGDILFEIENETYGVVGYAFCPLCGSQCVEIEEKNIIHEFKISGYEAVVKTVASGNKSSARINVPPSWQGLRVMVVRLE
jgi:hypothetical protein